MSYGRAEDRAETDRIETLKAGFAPGPEVVKVSYLMHASEEQLADAQRASDAIQRWFDATPAEREQWQREALERRAEERAQHEPVPLTLDALLDTLGFSVEYATHLVQRYCSCADSADGWDRCAHADDLGLR